MKENELNAQSLEDQLNNDVKNKVEYNRRCENDIAKRVEVYSELKSKYDNLLVIIKVKESKLKEQIDKNYKDQDDNQNIHHHLIKERNSLLEANDKMSSELNNRSVDNKKLSDKNSALQLEKKHLESKIDDLNEIHNKKVNELVYKQKDAQDRNKEYKNIVFELNQQ